jgi:hypothetical protein
MDEFYIIYKILKTLLENMGNKHFDGNSIDEKDFGISLTKFENILIMLSDKGYITGLTITSGQKGLDGLNWENIKLTYDGLCHLKNGFLLPKIKEFFENFD